MSFYSCIVAIEYYIVITDLTLGDMISVFSKISKIGIYSVNYLLLSFSLVTSESSFADNERLKSSVELCLLESCILGKVILSDTVSTAYKREGKHYNNEN